MRPVCFFRGGGGVVSNVREECLVLGVRVAVAVAVEVVRGWIVFWYLWCLKMDGIQWWNAVIMGGEK